ncbi:MAG: RidA family protein [Gemmatimonadetes bacterium]|nr:RidA family protein [Gemmatimonadota bacterium]MDA1102548.1 RidA family protein [Gemmatimonadota bacterium]
MKKISTTNSPTPAGHYSQAVVYGGVVYVAGQLGSDPKNPGGDPGDAGQQTRQALANVAAILEAAGSRLDCVIQMMIYVTDIDMWGEVNEAYAEVMGSHKPARAIVPVKNFKDRYVIEVVAIAALA